MGDRSLLDRRLAYKVVRANPYMRVADCRHCGGGGKVVRSDGAAMRRVREAAGVSLRSMAQRLGISPTFLSDIELDRRMAPDRVLAAYRADFGGGDGA